MKIQTDLYTKVVLTVIAVMLTLNFVKDMNFVTNAQAAAFTTFPAPLATQTDGVIDVNIVQVNGKNIDNLPVKVNNTSSQKISVDISSYPPAKVSIDNWP